MMDKDQFWELIAWAGIIGLLLLAFTSCTTADITPDSLMIGVPFSGDFDGAYWYLSWSMPQPLEKDR